MRKIGIECESIEGPESWGVGRIVKKLLEEISHRPELATEFRFFLYFKSCIPNLSYLDNPIFIKKVVGISSFSLYYYLFLPTKLWFEKLDMMFFPNYMLPILFRDKSLVILTEDIYYEIHSGTLPWRYKLAYKIFAGWWAARHATKIMAISETSKHELIKLFGISPNRIVVNTLGIDTPSAISNFHSDSRLCTGTFDEKFPISNEILNSKSQTSNQKLKTSNYILYVGQAFPRRHLRETMLAFEKLILLRTERLNLVEAQPLINIKLIAIGKDKYNPPIIKKLAEDINGRLGREAVIYKEYVSENELATLYAGARCVVYISSREAFGLPPFEALGYGIPAVVADQPITREIFGDNVFFVPASDSLGSSASKYLEAELPSKLTNDDNYDVETIAETIKKALTDTAKRQEIIANAEQILKKYTWQGFASRFLEIIKNR